MLQVIESAVAYLALKAAQRLYDKAPSELTPEEFQRVQQVAERQHALEARVLAAPEACQTMVPPATMQAALEEIRGRYESADEFAADMARNGLDEEGFTAALERELKVEAVMEKVATRAAQVSDTDVDLYYHYHPEKFRRPETRVARHILVTINEAIAENARVEARKRIDAIAARLHKEPQRFEEQALKHSECPTALQGGVLGEVPRGKLFPELDKALFEMKEGEVSEVLESSLGFHVLRCDTINPAGKLTQEQAQPHIRRLLENKRKRAGQQEWVKQLLKGE